MSSADDLEQALVAVCSSIEQQSSLRRVQEDYGVSDDAMKDLQRQLNTFTELQFESYRRGNSEMLTNVSAVVDAAVAQSIHAIREDVEVALQDLKRRQQQCGEAVSLAPYSKNLDKKFFAEKKVLSAAISTELRKTMHGSLAGVDIEALTTAAGKRLEEACVEMSEVLKEQHEVVARASVEGVAKGCVEIVSTQAMELLEHTSVITETSLRQQFAALIQEAVEAGAERLRGWGLPDDELSCELDVKVQEQCKSVLQTLLISHRKVTAMQAKLSEEKQQSDSLAAHAAENDKRKTASIGTVAANAKGARRGGRAPAPSAETYVPKNIAAPAPATVPTKRRRVTAVMHTAPLGDTCDAMDEADEETVGGGDEDVVDMTEAARPMKKSRRGKSVSSPAAATVSPGDKGGTEGKLSIAEQRKKAKEWYMEKKKDAKRQSLAQLEEEAVNGSEDGSEDGSEGGMNGGESTGVDEVEAAKQAARSRVQQRAQEKSGEARRSNPAVAAAAAAAKSTAKGPAGRRGKKGK